MRRMLPKCPHWGNSQLVPRMGTQNTGEYRCGKCGSCSNVSLDKRIYPLAVVAAVAGAIFFVLFVALVQEFSFTALVLIAAVSHFLFISPFFVRLRPIQQAKDPPSVPQSIRRRPVQRPVHDTQRVDIPREMPRRGQPASGAARGAPQRNPAEGRSPANSKAVVMDIKEAGREAGFGLSETILCILFEERAARFLGLADGTSVF